MRYFAVPIVRDPKVHTMESALYRYLDIKIHPLINAFQGKIIVVRGKYDREQSIVSGKEKNDKLFNWKRPTVETSRNNKILYLNCFPGIDYVYHYASIIKTYFYINKIKGARIVIDLPDTIESLRQLYKSNLTKMPKHDIVILGKVEHLTALTNSSWEGDGDFYWSSCRLHGKKLALLGCSFSIWGDIAANIIRVLAAKGTQTIIYTGKVGGLSVDMRPNETLATGNASWLAGTLLSWDNLIKIPAGINDVKCGNHITLFSILGETKKWLKRVGHNYSFVDPEIGHMAYMANKCKINFSYIHLVSDNVAQVRNENLSNERDQNIIKKRELSNVKILEILQKSIINS